MSLATYLEKVVTAGHAAYLQLAGQLHPCYHQPPALQPMQDESLIAIQVGLAGMKNGLY